MSKVTPKQIAKTIQLIADSGIGSGGYQALLASGRFSELLREFKGKEHPEPTLIAIKVPVDYSHTLVAMRDAAGCDGFATPDLNDENYPVETRESGGRELVLVCFHRTIGDDEGAGDTEILQELDKLGLQPEGPAELCAVVERHSVALIQHFPLVARGQGWRNSRDELVYPMFRWIGSRRFMNLIMADHRWPEDIWFLASRK